ncbi:MAG: glycosyltransferase, partial [Eggerthellaceae bacterium]|nr:glycosyltransferase [Eggerthellaceae bacterium]
MDGYYTYPTSVSGTFRKNRIAVVTQGVKLGDETRGYTRFRFIAQVLAEAGFDVDLITSTFQHWDKAQRDTTRSCYQGLPYRIQFVHEPGYKRNLDLARINSHRVLAGNLRRFFESRFADNPRAYDLIYSEIPPNDMARVCAEVARDHGIPYVPDVNDLWPEAMRMAVDIPVLSDIAFAPFARDAKKTYDLIAAAVGTSDEYAAQPSKYRADDYRRITVYVGNELANFDEGAADQAAAVAKPDDELWVIYTGTLGASYDIATLIEAARIAAQTDARIRVKILGDGPDREKLEQLAAETGAPVDFVGYAPYGLMAAYLKASDITVNSLVKSAPQSIVTKIGDYLAAGIPMINTGSSPEFRAKVEADGFGV